MMARHFLLQLLFCFSTLCLVHIPAIAQVFQWQDENGKTIFSNVPPPSGAKIDTSVKSKDSAIVDAYYKFCSQLNKNASNALNGEYAPREDIDLLTRYSVDMGDLLGKYPDRNISLSKKSEIYSLLAKTYREQSSGESSLGQHNDAMLNATRGQVCAALSLKLTMEASFEAQKIPFIKIEVPENSCLNHKNKTPETSKKRQATSTISADCEREWPGNYRMIEHCINQQSKALQTVSGMSGPIFDKCKDEWGDNYRMIEHCTRTQEEAKARLGM